MKFAQGGKALERLAGASGSRPKTPRKWRTITVGLARKRVAGKSSAC